LKELGSLVEQEQDLAVELLSRSRRDQKTALVKESELATKLIDRQLFHLQRVYILNEPLRQAERFAETLHRLASLMSDSQRIWDSIAEVQNSEVALQLRNVRSSIIERTMILHELETLHIQRMRIGLSRLYLSVVHRLSQLSPAILVLWLVALLGVGLDGYFLLAAWYKDKSIVDGYITTLSGIEDNAYRLELDPSVLKTEPGLTSQQQIVQLTANLGLALSPGKRPKYVQAPFESDMRQFRELVSRTSPRRSPEFDLPSGGAFYEVRMAAQYMIERLNSVSFSSFVIRFVIVNFYWFLVALVPLIIITIRGFIGRLSSRFRRLRASSVAKT
jgi:hypothetical protein